MATYFDNNGHTQSDVNLYPGMATIVTRMLPGYRYWSRPDAATSRRMIDAAIASSAMRNRKRIGRVKWMPTSGGWRATVELSDDTATAR